MSQATKTLVGIQRRGLEMQKSAVDNGYDVFARLEDQQREMSQRWLDQLPNLPQELRSASDAWWQARINTRESFKSAIDRSFQLLTDFYDRVAEPSS